MLCEIIQTLKNITWFLSYVDSKFKKKKGLKSRKGAILEEEEDQ
jgi:hypothetical protein